MLGWVFLGWTSTKQRVKCLSQGHNAVPSDEAQTSNPSISSEALFHWAAALLNPEFNNISAFKHVFVLHYYII